MVNESDFQYCPSCARHFNPLKGNLLVCPNCDLHYYINPKSTNAIMLFNEQDELLMVRRAHDPKKGKLDLPGGFIDINETLEESLTREIREELGIDVHEFEYVSSFHDEYEHGGISSRCLCMMFVGKLPENAILTPADDVASYEFYSLKNIPYEEMAFDEMKTAVKKYLLSL